ncbi:hypothetical protein AC244_15490 [Ensifer adhaerens]|uniref:Uncharacterized protein n=1 Tax=Ensifer adhaerens TaxID=106592 RepID=A0A0L8BSV6_ENSAD|nr:hypothetical protein [Ensifer adhaerens]KOF17792.1 hypothetical protein AC244_15490 [Ensifer adhaerens]
MIEVCSQSLPGLDSDQRIHVAMRVVGGPQIVIEDQLLMCLAVMTEVLGISTEEAYCLLLDAVILYDCGVERHWPYELQIIAL